MRTIVALALAGALGTLARFGVEGFISNRTSGGFPWGTLVVNVSGAFVLGLLFTVLTERIIVASWLRTAITVGFLGAYTTFSTLTFETLRLAQDGEELLAALNAVGSMMLGLIAAYGGVVAGRAI